MSDPIENSSPQDGAATATLPEQIDGAGAPAGPADATVDADSGVDASAAPVSNAAVERVAEPAKADSHRPDSSEVAAQPIRMPDFGTKTATAAPLANNIDLLGDVELNVTIELGRTEMFVEDVLRLGVGSVVPLDKLAGDPVDIFANDRLIGRGEVLVLNDNFCVRVSEIIDPGNEGAE